MSLEAGRTARRLRPAAVLADSGSWQRGLTLELVAGRVHSWQADAEPVDRSFPDEWWCAAPVLAHAHLESHDAPAALWPRASFAAWAEALLAWRAGGERTTPAAAARAALCELARAGCGAVLAHVAEPAARSAPHEAGAALPELVALPELFEPDPARAGAVDLPAPGVSLHSPFGVSLELARRAFASVARVSIHLGEHAEERRLLARGAGPLADLLRRRGRPLPQGRWASPVDWLAEAGGLRHGVIAVHATDLDAAELARLDAAGVALVWCPGTQRWFGRKAPAFLARDGPLPALGCDSRASNEALDPLREFRLACAELPGPGPAAWWRAATEGGAKLLGRDDLGHLRPGARCRFLRFRGPVPAGADEALGRLVAGERPIGGVSTLEAPAAAGSPPRADRV